MRSRYRYFSLLGIFVLTALACNLGVAEPPATEAPSTEPSQEDVNIAITYAVQTLQAQTQIAQSAALTATPTPLPSDPTVIVSSDTNCRTGPNINYDLVTVFQVGAIADIVAQYPNYWVIEYLGGNGATCWLWSNYATVTGDTSQLPLASPPPLPPTPTPAPQAPKAPKGLHLSCSSENNSYQVGDLWLISFEWTVEFTWDDNSDNEDGFSIYKNGSLLATVGPNEDSYTDVFSKFLVIEPVTYTYGVQSYNNNGASDIKEKEISTCD